MPQLMRPKNADPAMYLQWLFQKTESDIIDEILRKRKNGYVDYAEQAALERIQSDLQRMVDESFVYVPKLIEKNFYGPKSGYYNAKSIAGGTDRVMMETLADNLLGEIVEAAGKAGVTAGALYTIARLDNDALRKAALQSTAYAEALGKGAYTSSELMEATLRNNGVTAFVDKAGRRWSLTDYCNMASRTTARQAEVAGVLSADDHDLYQIVKIGTTCPVCAVYEGRVYSKSGTSPHYPPIAMAFGKIDPAGGDDLSNTYLNIHPNCLHSLIKFTEVGKTDKQLEKIREFSNPETNPLDHDPRSKKQIEAYREKERNRAKLLRELRKKEVEAAGKPAKPVTPQIPPIKKAATVEEAIKALTDEVGFSIVEDSVRKKVDPALLVPNANWLQELERKFGAIHKSTGPSLISEASGGAEAYVSSRATEPGRQKMSLCPGAFKERDAHIRTIMGQRGRGYSMPFKDELAEVYDVTHEYGHMIQNLLVQDEFIARGWNPAEPRKFVDYTKKTKKAMYKWYSNAEKAVEERCFDEIVQIARRNNPNFMFAGNLSTYGASNKGEFFAEVFANSQLGQPTELGVAMLEWLAEKGLVLI